MHMNEHLLFVAIIALGSTAIPGRAGEPSPAEKGDIEAMLRKGEMHLEAGQYEKGLEEFLAILSVADKKDPKIGSLYYDIACAYSLLKQKSPALEYLAKAVEGGFDNRDWMGRDPDLNSLHDEPEFKALLGKMAEIVEVPLTAQDERDEQEAVRTIEEIHKLKFKESPKFKILAPDQFKRAYGGPVESIQGFYRWDDKTLYLRQGLNPVNSKAVRIHESFHALQDQLFGMGEMHMRATTTDQGTTLTAVMEGDATLVFIESMPESGARAMVRSPGAMRGMGGGKPVYDRSENGEAARRARLLNYSTAARFVLAVKDARGWEGVNAIYAHLPASTEQVMHPEKYLDGNDPPIAVGLPDLGRALGAGWKISPPDVLGEFAIALDLLGNPRSGPVADEAAAGWGGDARVIAVHHETKTEFVVQETVWDTALDAMEYFRAAYLRFEVPGVQEKGGRSATFGRPENRVDYLEVADRMVYEIQGIPAELKDKVAALLRSRRRI
jgi:hypothetical protein